MWQNIRFGLRRFTIIAAGVLIATAWFAGDAKVYAGTAGDDAVLLDPFDPVPQIGFRHGECDDPCGYHRCHDSCYHRRPRCERECCRECDEAYWAYIWSLRRYERETDTYGMLLDIYVNELKAYDRRYLDGHGHVGERIEEWQRAYHNDVPHYGAADHHYGDRDNHDDGDMRDGGRHDGDGHDGDHRDGDHHDDGQHDGDRSDGDGHDGDHHDGQWQDRDGNWHDGPPPDGYGH